MQNPIYIPIDCSFYDNLEAFATTRQAVEINYLDENYEKIIHQKIKIKDLETKNGEEFMSCEVIENGELTNEKIKIRLDRLLDIDGIKIPKNGESCVL